MSARFRERARVRRRLRHDRTMLPRACPGTTQNYRQGLVSDCRERTSWSAFCARSPGVDKASSEAAASCRLESTEILSQTNRAVPRSNGRGAQSATARQRRCAGNEGSTALREIQEMSLTTPNHFDRETSFQTGAVLERLDRRRGPSIEISCRRRSNYYPDRIAARPARADRWYRSAVGNAPCELSQPADRQLPAGLRPCRRVPPISRRSSGPTTIRWTAKLDTEQLCLFRFRCVAADAAADGEPRIAPRAQRRLVPPQTKGRARLARRDSFRESTLARGRGSRRASGPPST